VSRLKDGILDKLRPSESPVARLSGMIRDTFWDNLTRRIDASGIEAATIDSKDRTDNPRPRIYVPPEVLEQYAYYLKVAKEQPNLGLDVQLLPEGEATPEFTKNLNSKFGLLALDVEYVERPGSGEKDLRGVPFVVPGGRFNEMYGWDSYFCGLGLLADGRSDLVKAMVQNFVFEIQHYGKILNATRSYYLCRSQPPILTDMALRTYNAIQHEPGSKDFLKKAILSAIKEYHGVWMAEPRYDPNSGLSRYRHGGLGVPPETEPDHFVPILTPYARKRGLTVDKFVQLYNDGEVKEPDLDEYFLHDRAVRESGHDTSCRLEGVAANLATIDLNTLLFKYETDIAQTIRTVFEDKLVVPPEMCAPGQEPNHIETSALWDERAKKRKTLIDTYLWNEDKGLYFDYNTVTKEQAVYESATCLWALWSGVADPRQAALLVSKGLPKFECSGGIVSGSQQSKGDGAHNHQWDYPYGWAPHQVLAWDGLIRYGLTEDAKRLVYRWLHTITKAFVAHDEIVAEKYNVVQSGDPREIKTGYGNQGDDSTAAVRGG
jgi:alpha,alpha-trehalase